MKQYYHGMVVIFFQTRGCKVTMNLFLWFFFEFTPFVAVFNEYVSSGDVFGLEKGLQLFVHVDDTLSVSSRW